MAETTINESAPVAAGSENQPPQHFSKSEIRLALMMLVSGYLCVKLVLSGGQGLGVSVFTLLFCLELLYWFRLDQQKLGPESAVYLALILLTAAYFALFDNELLKFLALLLLPLLTGYFIASVSGSRLEARLGPYLLFDLGGTLLARPLGNISVGPRILRLGAQKSQKSHTVLMLLLGLALALPLCIFVSALLKQADPAFTALWERLADSLLSDAIVNIMQLVISLPLACYFFALLYGSKKPGRSLKSAQQLSALARFLPGLLLIGGVTPLLLIYVLFFCSQTAYFLSAFSGLLPAGYIYADYARRGFFELCAVSGVNFAAIFVLLFLRKQDSGSGRVYRLYTVTLALFSLALIAISLQKMILYIQIYGLTPLRVYTSWFMLLLALIFVFIIVKTYAQRFNAAKWTAIAAVSMFLILCFANPDAQIARYNVRAYADGRLQQLDVLMLDELGDAATPYLLEVANMEQIDPYSRDLARGLLGDKAYAQQCYAQERDWRAFNLTSWRSRQLLQEAGMLQYSRWSVK